MYDNDRCVVQKHPLSQMCASKKNAVPDVMLQNRYCHCHVLNIPKKATVPHVWFKKNLCPRLFLLLLLLHCYCPPAAPPSPPFVFDSPAPPAALPDDPPFESPVILSLSAWIFLHIVLCPLFFFFQCAHWQPFEQ
jgi:hypothetical protein